MTDLLARTHLLEPTFDEQDSFVYLASMYREPWLIYSSRDYPIDEVVNLIESFVMLHASVELVHMGIPRLWSPISIGSFRYVMTENQTWTDYLPYKPLPGYLVEGAYWSNGLYYLVSYQDFLLEATLFVDSQTKLDYNYP